MKVPRPLRWPNILIGIGLLPMLLWISLIFWAVSFAKSTGNVGITDYFLLMVTGVVAYVATVLVSGAGMLWADRVLRKSGAAQPRTTLWLVQIVFIFLISPWVLLLGRALI